MLINIGRLLMLCVWGFLILNIFQPFPRPLNIFVNVAPDFYRADAWYATGAIAIDLTKRWPADDDRRKGAYFPFRRV